MLTFLGTVFLLLIFFVAVLVWAIMRVAYKFDDETRESLGKVMRKFFGSE